MPRLNFVVRVAVCFLFIFLPLHTLDQWFYDHFFTLRGKQNRPTSFILIRVNDAKLYPPLLRGTLRYSDSLATLEPKQHAIWFRDFYDGLIQRIERDQPQLIIFTSFYDATEAGKPPTPPPPNVIFAAALNEENKLVPPLSGLVSGDNYGFGNIFPDPDNIVRRSHLVYSSGISLALRTYHRLVQEPVKRNLLDPLWIDYRGPAGSYPSLSAWRLAEDGAPPGTFKDKIVLIGRDTSGISDPETPFGRISRLEIQANILDTFLSHRDIRILPRAVTLVTAGLAVAASVVIILFFPLTLAWLFLLLLSLLIMVTTLFFFSELKIWPGVANPLFCIFGTHLLMLGYKLSREEEHQWRIQQEAEYLKELDQFKNNFISLFSHDLKTPIAKIKAVTDRLLTEHADLKPEVRESLKSIDRTNGELARFISDILKVTKMESMPLEVRKEVIDLNRLVEVAVQRLKFMADEKKISIVLDLEPLFSMEGDQQLIQEVITNLVENAIKYSPADRKVIVRTREEDKRVTVAVVDEGVGIAADELPRVTGKFYRGRAVGEKVKGSGLGLYLAKYFVELHQGKLELKSELGKGTEVSFWLPISA